MIRTRSQRAREWVQAHPWAGPTVLGALVFILAASVARAFTYPPLASGDEPAHLDYVITVWHGHLPVFQNGLTYRAPFGVTVPVQWVSQHPPLYYLLLAPIVGPLWDSGHVLLAVMAGRAASAVLIAVAVPATAWAAWRCFPGHRRLPGAAAVVTALAGIIVQQGSSIYNDALYYPLLVLACGIAGAALRSGVRRGLFVAAVLVTAAGMTTRLSFVLWMAAVVVAMLLARDVRLWRLTGIPARIVAAVVPVLAAAGASGWFYLRNKALTGNFSGRHAEWGLEHANRVERSVGAVAGDGAFWRGIFGIYRGAVDPLDWSTWLVLLVPLGIAVVAGVVAVLRVWGRRRSAGSPSARTADAAGSQSARTADAAGSQSARTADAADDATTTTDTLPLDGRRGARVRRDARRDRLGIGLVVAMFVVVTVLLVVTELDYVSGGGAPNTRYSMTVLPVIAIGMAAGLTAWRRASGVLVTLWIAAAMVPYLTLVDLHVVSIVPHAARIVQASFAVSLVGLALCLVGAFADARRPRTPAGPSGDADQARAAASSSR